MGRALITCLAAGALPPPQEAAAQRSELLEHLLAGQDARRAEAAASPFRGSARGSPRNLAGGPRLVSAPAAHARGEPAPVLQLRAMTIPTLLLAALVALLPPQRAEAQSRLFHAHRDADHALQAGELDLAREGFRRCLELEAELAAAAYGLACVAARAGERDAALEWLERALEWGYHEPELARWDEDLASLRGEPRFLAAVAAMVPVDAPSPIRVRSVRDERQPDAVTAVAVDPDGAWVWVGHYSGRLAQLDARTGLDLDGHVELGSPVRALAARPGGVAVAFTCDGNVHFHRAGGERRVVEVDPTHQREWCTLLLEPDPAGERLLAAGSASGAAVLSVDGELLARHYIPAARCGPPAVAWSHGGRRVAVAQDEQVRFADPAVSESIEAWLTTPASIRSLHADPAGRFLATGHVDGALRVWDAETYEIVFETAPERDVFDDVLEIAHVRFSPSGRRLACTTAIGVRLHVYEVEGWSARYVGDVVGGRSGEAAAIAWSPDESRVWYAFVSGSLPVYEVALGGAATQRRLPRGDLPSMGASGLAAHVTWHGVSALDAASGAVRWTRASLARAGWLVHSVEGWLDTDLDDLEELLVDLGDRRRPEPLEPILSRLFDPKRLRAARAGVRLSHPLLVL